MNTAMIRILASLAIAAISFSAWAQPATDSNAAGAPASAIEYKSVSQALAALEAEDGKSTVVTHPEGWVVVNEPAAAAQWSFTPPGYYAYPAVVRRIIRRGPNKAVSVETSSLCEAPAESCARLLKEFASMNDRITQATRARAGAGGAQP
jgi:hypothetical protein